MARKLIMGWWGDDSEIQMLIDSGSWKIKQNHVELTIFDKIKKNCGYFFFSRKLYEF